MAFVLPGESEVQQMPPLDFTVAVQDALEAAHDAESHIERDATTFHPSQMAKCRRQCYLSKLGLLDQSDALGVFQPGTLIHEFLEEHIKPQHRDHYFEYPVRHDASGLTIAGRTDCYDPERGIVYDIKTRGGWYRFDPPNDRHLDQVHAYIAALGASKAQIVYVSKKDISEVRPWPAWDDDADSEYIDFDESRFSEMLMRAHDVRTAIQRHGMPTEPEDIPFEKCDCYACQNEALALPDNVEGGLAEESENATSSAAD